MTAYNHSCKAGNIGDVFKHLVLVETVRHLIERKAATHNKDFTFGYMETHCGAPEHKLMPKGEWENGIGKFLENDDMYDLNYFHYVVDGVQINQMYPSSWVLARKAIRSSAVSSYSISLFDTSADVVKIVKPIADRDENIHFDSRDGYKHFKDKPMYRTDFVLIDPSYKTGKGEKSSKDWLEVVKTAEFLKAKGIPFMLWYPFYTDKFSKALLTKLELPTLQLVDESIEDPNTLKGSGLIFGNIDEKFIRELKQLVTEPLKQLGGVTKFY